ncbi:MAG: response regulator transcription factor [Thermoanaerobaculia bacterium]|jgi:two-component system response regulator NreC|nr:response regulator transcription factor [Thermoanaerobaculia bacterium]MBP9823413.1 response regulator transcription factor [Thermoanaerobaculia bacterium]
MAMPHVDLTHSYPTEDWNLTDADASRPRAFLYVIDRAKESQVLAAIRAACGCDIHVQPAAFHLAPQQLASRRSGRVPPEVLTRRETEVLCLLARGNTNRQAADLLGLSVRTVENHRANLLEKLGVAGRVEIVRYATEFNLI